MLRVMMGGVVVVVLGAGVLLVAAARQWRGRPRKPPGEAAPRPHHLHYCTGCDKQWEHGGHSAGCTRYWAARCPVCAPA
jgi:hypothetical protein